MSAALEGQTVTKRRKVTVTRRHSRPTIEEMEKALGLDQTRPITLSPSDEKDTLEKGDAFGAWYEEELRELYRHRKDRSS